MASRSSDVTIPIQSVWRAVLGTTIARAICTIIAISIITSSTRA